MNKTFFQIKTYKYLFFISLFFLFMFFPEIDLKVTSFFYSNHHFFETDKTIPKAIMFFAYSIAPILPIIFVSSLFILLLKNLLQLFLQKRKTKRNNLADISLSDQKNKSIFNIFWSNIRNKQYTFLILALLLGPGVFVNSIAKEFSGRSRPRDVKVFGGKYNHTGPISCKRDCKKNCSFVSGHASAGFYFITLSFLFLPGSKKRKLIFYIAFLYGSYVGLTRIIIGAHFLSDIIFAFAFVYFISQILYFYIFKKDIILDN